MRGVDPAVDHRPDNTVAPGVVGAPGGIRLHCGCGTIDLRVERVVGPRPEDDRWPIGSAGDLLIAFHQLVQVLAGEHTFVQLRRDEQEAAGNGWIENDRLGIVPLPAGAVRELSPERFKCLAYGPQATRVGRVDLEQDRDLLRRVDLVGDFLLRVDLLRLDPARALILAGAGPSLRLPTIGDRYRPSSSFIAGCPLSFIADRK